MKTQNEIKKNLIKGAIITAAVGLLALAPGASSASATTQGCRTSSGRIICSFSSVSPITRSRYTPSPITRSRYTPSPFTLSRR
jgi:hypothetical protein